METFILSLFLFFFSQNILPSTIVHRENANILMDLKAL